MGWWFVSSYLLEILHLCWILCCVVWEEGEFKYTPTSARGIYFVWIDCICWNGCCKLILSFLRLRWVVNSCSCSGISTDARHIVLYFKFSRNHFIPLPRQTSFIPFPIYCESRVHHMVILLIYIYLSFYRHL